MVRPHGQRREAGREGSRRGQVRLEVRIGSRPGCSGPRPARAVPRQWPLPRRGLPPPAGAPIHQFAMPKTGRRPAVRHHGVSWPRRRGRGWAGPMRAGGSGPCPAAGFRCLPVRRSINSRCPKTVRRSRRGRNGGDGPNARGGAARIQAPDSAPGMCAAPRCSAVVGGAGGGRLGGWAGGGPAAKPCGSGAVRPGFDRAAAAAGGPNANPCDGRAANKK